MKKDKEKNEIIREVLNELIEKIKAIKINRDGVEKYVYFDVALDDCINLLESMLPKEGTHFLPLDEMDVPFVEIEWFNKPVKDLVGVKFREVIMLRLITIELNDTIETDADGDVYLTKSNSKHYWIKQRGEKAIEDWSKASKDNIPVDEPIVDGEITATSNDSKGLEGYDLGKWWFANEYVDVLVMDGDEALIKDKNGRRFLIRKKFLSLKPISLVMAENLTAEFIKSWKASNPSMQEIVDYTKRLLHEKENKNI